MSKSRQEDGERQTEDPSDRWLSAELKKSARRLIKWGLTFGMGLVVIACSPIVAGIGATTAITSLLIGGMGVNFVGDALLAIGLGGAIVSTVRSGIRIGDISVSRIEKRKE